MSLPTYSSLFPDELDTNTAEKVRKLEKYCNRANYLVEVIRLTRDKQSW